MGGCLSLRERPGDFRESYYPEENGEGPGRKPRQLHLHAPQTDGENEDKYQTKPGKDDSTIRDNAM